MKLGEIAERLACKLEGDAGIEITGVAGIEEAEPGQLTFLCQPALSPRRGHNARVGDFDRAGRRRRATGVLTLEESLPRFRARARIFPSGAELFSRSSSNRDRVEHRQDSFRRAYRTVLLCRGKRQNRARRDPAQLCDHLSRGAHWRRVLCAFPCIVREGCEIGHRVILQNGVVVGADGFGFARRDDGSWKKIRQAASVIEDDVEIQANACVDRATVGETRLRAAQR